MTEIEQDAARILRAFRLYQQKYVWVVYLREDTGLPRGRFDAAARYIVRQRLADFIPESNQKALTRGQRSGAVVIGNQDNHLMCM